MKKTKNMFINPTVESRELFLFTVNESKIYPMIQNYVRSLAKKYNKNVYCTDKAIDGYFPIVTVASNLYNKYYGYKFTVNERYNAAAEIEKYYLENVINNDL